MSKIKKIILAGLLLATTIVLSRFLSIKTPIVVISFSFIPVMLSGILLGPWYTMLISSLADLIGALLFPFGAYFVGYTISACLAGFIYGIFLQRKNNPSAKKLILKLILSCLVVLIVCNGVLNSLWIYITTKKAFWAILPTRLLKQLAMLPIQVSVIYFLNLGLDKMGLYKRLFCKDEQLKDEQLENLEQDEEKQVLEENLQTESTSNTPSEVKNDKVWKCLF